MFLKDGLARFCTVKYDFPNSFNLDQLCMHLTNYSLNKTSSYFKHSDSVDSGSKRSYISIKKVWIESIVIQCSKLKLIIRNVILYYSHKTAFLFLISKNLLNVIYLYRPNFFSVAITCLLYALKLLEFYINNNKVTIVFSNYKKKE